MLIEELQESAAANRIIVGCAGIFVMAILNARTFAEEHIGFIQEKNRSRGSGRMQKQRKRVDGIACVLTHHCLEVDTIEFQMQVSGERLRSGSFGSMVETGEEGNPLVLRCRQKSSDGVGRRMPGLPGAEAAITPEVQLSLRA